MNSFKQNVKEGAVMGAILGAGVTADAGNPLLNAAAGGVIGAAGGAISHLRDRRKVSSPRKSSFHDSVNATGQTSFKNASEWMK